MPTSRRIPPPGADAPVGGKRTLKKYLNRRLYDTQTGSHITLADVKRMVLSSEDFEVRDAKTGGEITRGILLQIILEEDSGGVPMFTNQTLAQIIRFYGHAKLGMMGVFMDNNLRAFVDLQTRLAEQGKGCTTPRSSRPRCGPSSAISGQARGPSAWRRSCRCSGRPGRRLRESCARARRWPKKRPARRC